MNNFITSHYLFNSKRCVIDFNVHVSLPSFDGVFPIILLNAVHLEHLHLIFPLGR